LSQACLVRWLEEVVLRVKNENMSRERGYGKIGPRRYLSLKAIGNRTFYDDIWDYGPRLKMEYLCVCDQTIHDQTTDDQPSIALITRTRDRVSNHEYIN
jgi:hypothetical protein